MAFLNLFYFTYVKQIKFFIKFQGYVIYFIVLYYVLLYSVLI